MKKSITVFGPRGSSKTHNGEALRKHFGLGYIWDEGKAAPGSRPCEFETLILQEAQPSDLEGAMHIEIALRLIGAK